MTNRRFFLVQGTLATTAMFILKPLTTIGGAVSQFTDLNESYGKLALLHTASVSAYADDNVFQYLARLKSNHTNAILLDAGQGMEYETATLPYDVSINRDSRVSAITGNYKILHKGNIKTGVIIAKTGDSDIIQNINSLAAFLKKEKKCTLVVCLSQLGYKNTNNIDDTSLAKNSNDLDIIIGGNVNNFYKHPVVLLNNKNSEVIIHSAAGDFTSMGKIEIDFDNRGRKKNINFTN
jgi:2',3'-cyclic-nucleotide 2'-phosphodiesterase (5'-nucleotidase family)